MRERVRIDVPSSSSGTSTDGDQGAYAYRALATVWGEVTPLSGSERLRAAALGSEVRYRVRLVHRTDVTEAARLVCLGPDYRHCTLQIQAAISDHAKGRLILDCAEAR